MGKKKKCCKKWKKKGKACKGCPMRDKLANRAVQSGATSMLSDYIVSATPANGIEEGVC